MWALAAFGGAKALESVAGNDKCATKAPSQGGGVPTADTSLFWQVTLPDAAPGSTMVVAGAPPMADRVARAVGDAVDLVLMGPPSAATDGRFPLVLVEGAITAIPAAAPGGGALSYVVRATRVINLNSDAAKARVAPPLPMDFLIHPADIAGIAPAGV